MDGGGDSFARLHEFAACVAGAPDDTPLDEAALLIASVLRRDVDVDEALTTLDLIAAECPSPTFEGVRRHLFDTLGFGRVAPRGDPSDSFLDVVLARRCGLPILQATVIMEVSRRIGVTVHGVNLPLHFMVRDGGDVFADPASGEILDADGVRARFETLAQGQLAWSERHLRPVPARHIVIRMLTNLQAAYQQRRDPVRLALVARLRSTIPELAQEASAAARLGAVFN